jgi:2-polyprenyl-6-methoxyphenol hydroxylase-like FAD-dependent oxidoreductase
MSGIVVVGAGMAGLLAGSMLRKDCPLILEARERLPHNHSAVLRFRSSIVGDTVRQIQKLISDPGSAYPHKKKG